MPYLLRLHADTSLSAIQAALGRIRPRDIALIFPYGTPVALAGDADFVALHTLHGYCETLGKAVVIIGGDEALRAAAVATGFASATSLDAWKGASGSRFPRLVSAPAEEWPAQLSFVSADPDQEADFDVLPEYVQQLLGDDQEFTGPRDHDVDFEARFAHDSHPFGDDDSASIASESYEEGITSTIRGTSGLEKWPDMLGSSSEEGKSSDSSTM